MALTLRNRPKGPIIRTTSKSTSITDSSSNALVNYSSHGLTNGDWVLVDAVNTYYSGLWQVVTSGADAFFITKFVGHPVVSFVATSSATTYKNSGIHSFNSIHLPIVYNFTSDLWPINGVDTAATVNTFTNDQGYTKLTLSADIKATGSVQALEFVKVTVNSVEGIYQILQAFSDTEITIDLSYDGGNTFGTCQYYYANYHAKVKIYAGIISGTGTTYNPVELIATIDAVPQLVIGPAGTQGNVINLNINEILKSKIDILKNDPTSIGLPRDLDAFCEFYIEYAESYDQSLDGYTLGTYTSSYTSDSANVCYAVNAKLPFKNRYSGFMSDYSLFDLSSKFLTTMEAPSIWSGYYFDYAFLNPINYGKLILTEQGYLAGVAGTSVLTTKILNGNSRGVFRIESVYSDNSGSFGTVDSIRATITQDVNNGTFASNITYWENHSTGDDWVHDGAVGGRAKVSISSGGSKTFRTRMTFVAGTYDISFDYQITGAGAATISRIITAVDGSPSQTLSIVGPAGASTGTYNGTYTVSLGQEEDYYFGVSVSGSTTISLFIDNVQVTKTLSETKTIDTNTECSNQDIYLTWKNYLGGHDYWLFTAEKEYGVDILETNESTKNIFTEWPKSYGEFSDTIEYETSRRSKDTILVRSQNLTLEQVQGLKYIKTSPLVQIMTSEKDRRTVLVDSNSFVVYSETDKLYGIQFTIRYTDDIPSQSL